MRSLRKTGHQQRFVPSFMEHTVHRELRIKHDRSSHVVILDDLDMTAISALRYNCTCLLLVDALQCQA